MYIIFGCNTVGKALAQYLSKLGEEILVIGSDETGLIGLQASNLRTLTADINTLDFGSLPVKDTVAFILLQENFKDNLTLANSLKKLFPDKFIVSRATEEKENSALLEHGVDCAVQTVSIITNAMLSALETAKIKRSVFHLVRVMKAAANKGIAIFLQDNPDPDAIASGFALKCIAEKYGIRSNIYYGGNIGRQQNKTLIDLFQTDLIRLITTDEALKIINSFDKVALIEASIPSKNNIVPTQIIPNIVIDHHQTDFSLVKGEFVEILPKIGATSTIMTRYLRHLDIVPDPSLATALRYGIRVDTGGFTRNTTTEDLDAAAYLSPLLDAQLLNHIENPPMSTETMDIIGRTIQNREVIGSYLISFVEFITERDALPQAAELMLQMAGVSTALVFGINKDKVQLSARSVDTEINLAFLLQKAFGFMNAGGHANMAAGSIDLGIFGDVNDKKSLSKIIHDVIRKRFFSAVGIDFEKQKIPDELELVVSNSFKN